MNTVDAKRVLETALICAQQPVPVRELRELFNDALGSDTLKVLLQELQLDWAQRGVELVQVATGWRFQSRPEMREYLDRLHPEKPPRYTRATMETLAASLRANRATSDRDISQLTPRERDILKLIAQGLPNKMIARRLDITESTVKVHVKHMLKKMKLKSRVEAAVWVHQERIF